MNSLAYIPASDGAANASLMTVTNVRSPGAATLQVNTVANAPTKFYASMGTPNTFTDPVTGETITVISEATAVDFAGTIDGSNVEIVEIAPGYTDAGSEVGDVIVIRPVTEWANNIFNTLSVAHNDDGTLAADSVTTEALADGSVTEDKLDLTTLGFGNYSTSEVDTGFKWINGKTIYKKTINTGSLPNNTTKNVNHGITGLDTVINFWGSTYSPTGSYWDLLPAVNGETQYLVGIRVYPTNVRLQTVRDMTNYTTSYVTLYYTKV